MCATCPFRKGSKYGELTGLLSASALNEGSRICHATGHAQLVRSEGKAKLCRGARNLQLDVFHGLGLLSEPTDEAWEKLAREIL